MLDKLKKHFFMIGECIRMSLSNIWNNKMRSFLTVLGIFIGVTAVIALITTVSGFSGSLSSSFESMGAGTMIVSVPGSTLKSGLTPEDLNDMAELDYVKGVTPSVSLRTRVSHDGIYDSDISVSGKNAFYFRYNDDLLSRGRALNIIDEDNTSFVCLLTQEMVERFFFGVDPIGETLYINGMPFTVIGIVSDADSASFATLLSGDSDILIPYTTAMKMNNTNVVHSLTVYLSDGTDSKEASLWLEDHLNMLFNYEDDCFTVTNLSGMENIMQSTLAMVSTLLTGIASIALLVGGIGIMNMMLTTVTERTVEIGLKKALGALPWQIQMQFLIESFLLSMIGGILGIVFGLVLSYGLCNFIGMEFVLSTKAIALGAGFSAAVGIIFGWAPARKASRLNPIDALRAM